MVKRDKDPISRKVERLLVGNKIKMSETKAHIRVRRTLEGHCALQYSC